MFPSSGAWSNPWNILEQNSRPMVTILAGPLLIGLILYEFNISFRAQIYSWCFLSYFLVLSTSSLWEENIFMFLCLLYVVNSTVYHLLVLTWGLRYFWKRGNIRKGCVEIEDWGSSYNLYQGFRKIICKGCLIFNCFLVIKGILKALFPFIPSLLNFSDFPNFGSNSRKKYTLRLLSKCLVRRTLLPIGDKVPHNPSIPSSIFLDGLLLA